MAKSRRLTVRFDDAVWREAVRGFSGRAWQIAASARTETEQHGISLADVLPCEADGRDGTRLAGCAKLYLPFGDGPASERPYAFVLQLARDGDASLVWAFVAFGVRHPEPGVRSVYERAHRQLHGWFPEPRRGIN